jgi:hypothetical protein
VASTLKYLASDELEGREWDSRHGKICRLSGILKEQCKALFSSYRDTITNKGTAYNVVGYVEGIDPVLKKEFY